MQYDTIDLKGKTPQSTTIEFLVAEAPVPRSFLARVVYAKNGMEQKFGLRIDQSKGFLQGDFPDHFTTHEREFVAQSALNIMRLIWT